MWAPSAQVFRTGSSENQVLSVSHSRLIRFFQPDSPVNQMIVLFESRPIRFFGSGRPGNQMEGPHFITGEKLLFFFLFLNIWLMDKGYHFDELF
jgi:hypothetical protein